MQMIRYIIFWRVGARTYYRIYTGDQSAAASLAFRTLNATSDQICMIGIDSRHQWHDLTNRHIHTHQHRKEYTS